MNLAVYALLLAVTAAGSAQKKSPQATTAAPTPAAAGAAANTPAVVVGALPSNPQPSLVFTPKETKAALRLQLAVERENTVGLEAQMVQKSIEPQMRELQGKYAEQEVIVTAGVDEVRKENEWGKDVVLDRNPQSPTFGKWIKAVVPPALTSAPPAAGPSNAESAPKK